MLSNKLYDTLKFIAQIILPGLATLYMALSKIWGFPFGEAVVGTITAVVAFLGLVLRISTVEYNAKSNAE